MSSRRATAGILWLWALLMFAACAAPPAPPAATSIPTPSPGPSLAPSRTRFDGQRAYQHVLDQCALGPRPPGTPALRRTADYILSQLTASGWITETQVFDYQGVAGQNIYGKRGNGPLLILGAHYDTRPIADRDPEPANRNAPILGANDGGSGVAVLLELARVLGGAPLQNEVWLTFFDLEDSGEINGWPWGVGSQYAADHLTEKPQAVIVVDMVGDSDQQIYWEGNSDPALLRDIWAIAADLGYGQHFIPQYKYTIIDDHVPFREKGIPAVDLIDFDYPRPDLNYHHTLQDTCDKVSAAPLERVGRTLQQYVLGAR